MEKENIKNDFYAKEYVPSMNRIGKITGYLGVLISFMPLLVIGVGYGIIPDWAALLTAFISVASAVGIMWVIEPVMYFPVLGSVGTYITFLSGNGTNMRIPCAKVAQASAGVEAGSEEGSIIATLGISVSVFVNIIILTIASIFGSAWLAKLPEGITEALNYLLPALFGALLGQAAFGQKKQTAVMLGYAVFIYMAVNGGLFSWLPGAMGYIPTLTCVIFSIFYGVRKMKKIRG